MRAGARDVLTACFLTLASVSSAPAESPHEALAREAAERPAITLDAAISEAFTRSPALTAARAQVEEARGRRVAARTYPYNPVVGVERSDREGPAVASIDRAAALSQQIEIAGQRGRRAAVAEEEVLGLEDRYERARRRLAASVSEAFVDALSAQELADLAALEASLAEELLDTLRDRFDAGRATQVDLSLALASAARAGSHRGIATSRALVASSRLAEVVGLDPAAPPRVAGPLAVPPGEPAPLDQLLSEAMRNRTDLLALEHDRLAAEAGLRLARAGRVPDLTIGAFYVEEENVVEIVGATLGVEVPIFRRNRGEIAEARAAISRVEAEAEAQVLAARREVYSAVARYEVERSAAEQLAQRAVGDLREGLALLDRSFQTGETDLSALLVLRRELLDARREQIEATAAAWTARIALDEAVGRLPLSATDAGSLPGVSDE